MRAFEVYVNGKKLCLAGIGDNGVLTAIVNWVTHQGKGDMFLEVGGLVSPAREPVAWVNQKPLRVGDEIRVKIVRASSPEIPIKRHRTDPAEELRSQKRYVRMMAKKLGWKIQARSKRSTA
jgi:hypothetical protein